MTTGAPPSSTAVWYFVGATFIFISPILFFRDAGAWLNILTVAVGAAVFGAGMVVFRREQAATGATDDLPGVADPADPASPSTDTGHREPDDLPRP
ncbi:hypothetical protein ACFM35_06600 [Microbacterium sp. P01]|uniref:hypothetical protein n=1 Tax=Microbacterium sp. P01 TaxID=3366261 RepID=UPI0036723400